MFTERPYSNTAELLKDTAFLSQLNRLRLENRYCDVVLRCNGKRYHAHKVVLAAQSTTLDSLMLRTSNDTKCVDLTFPDALSDDSLSALLTFLYSGYVQINRNNFISLLKLAINLKLSNLLTLCCLVEVDVKIHNLLRFVNICVKCKDTEIRESLCRLVSENCSAVCRDSSFHSLPVGLFMSMMEMDEMTRIGEDIRFDAFMWWLSGNIKERKKYLASVFSTIRWASLSKDFVINLSLSFPFHKNDDCLYILFVKLEEAGFSLGDANLKLYQKLSAKFKDVHLAEVEPPRDVDLPEEVVSIEIRTSRSTDVLPCAKCNRSIDGCNCDDVFEDDAANLKSIDELLKEIDDLEHQLVNDDDKECNGSMLESKPVSSFCANQVLRKQSGVHQMNQKAADFGGISSKSEDCVESNSETFTENLNVKKFNRTKLKPKVKPSYESSEKDSAVRDTLKCWEDDCDYETGRDDDMEHHLTTTHGLQMSMRCQLCSFACCYSRVFYTHMGAHFPGPPFTCDQTNCAFVAERLQALLSHRFVHSEQRPFECTRCGRTFRTKASMAAHKNHHCKMKRFACNRCTKTFSRLSFLRQHELIHSVNRPFLCDLCGFTTRYQSHLASHKKIHSGDVVHCTEPGCSYATPKRSVLAAHLRSHSQIRSNVCDLCGKRFIEKSHLIRHARIHRRDAWLTCDLCDYATSRRDKYAEHRARYHAADAPNRRRPRRQRRDRPTTSAPSSTDSPRSQRRIERTAPVNDREASRPTVTELRGDPPAARDAPENSTADANTLPLRENHELSQIAISLLDLQTSSTCHAGPGSIELQRPLSHLHPTQLESTIHSISVPIHNHSSNPYPIAYTANFLPPTPSIKLPNSSNYLSPCPTIGGPAGNSVNFIPPSYLSLPLQPTNMLDYCHLQKQVAITNNSQAPHIDINNSSQRMADGNSAITPDKVTYEYISPHT